MDAKVDERASTRNVWRGIMWAGLAVLLSLPALAMSLGTEGVDWSAADFVVMGGLMILLGTAVEMAVRLLRSWRARGLAIAIATSVFVAVWIELGVGAFGTPFTGS